MGRRKTNKQAPLSKEGEEKKEEKAKNTYTLSKADGKDLTDNTEGIEKVSIPDNLEREIVEMILQEHQNGKALEYFPNDVYNSLSSAGFSYQQVEAAMTATVSEGGDVHDALDWLCLNTANDQLPKGFSQTLQEEEKKHRPRFDPSQQVDARMGCAPQRQHLWVVYAFGGLIKYTIEDITPTFLTKGVLSSLRQADYKATSVLQESGFVSSISQMSVILIPIPIHFDRDPTLHLPSYQCSVVIRTFITNDFMTGVPAEPGKQLPEEVLAQIVSAVLEVPGVSRVLYDLTAKLPGTTEWE